VTGTSLAADRQVYQATDFTDWETQSGAGREIGKRPADSGLSSVVALLRMSDFPQELKSEIFSGSANVRFDFGVNRQTGRSIGHQRAFVD